MTDTPEKKAPWYSQIGEEKLLALLLLGLGFLLLVILLLWRSLDQQGEKDIVPVAESKRSIWFDENGPKSSNEEARTKSVSAAPPAQQPPKVTDAAESLVVKTVDLNDQPASVQVNIEQPNFWVQLASFSLLENADALAKRVSAEAPQVEVVPIDRGNKALYVVRVPVIGLRAEAENLAATLSERYSLKPLVVAASS